MKYFLISEGQFCQLFEDPAFLRDIHSSNLCKKYLFLILFKREQCILSSAVLIYNKRWRLSILLHKHLLSGDSWWSVMDRTGWAYYYSGG